MVKRIADAAARRRGRCGPVRPAAVPSERQVFEAEQQIADAERTISEAEHRIEDANRLIVGARQPADAAGAAPAVTDTPRGGSGLIVRRWACLSGRSNAGRAKTAGWLLAVCGVLLWWQPGPALSSGSVLAATAAGGTLLVCAVLCWCTAAVLKDTDR